MIGPHHPIMGFAAWVLRENSAEKHSGGTGEVLRINRTTGQVPKNDEADTVPHLPIAIRSITMSSAVISSPEAAEVRENFEKKREPTKPPQKWYWRVALDVTKKNPKSPFKNSLIPKSYS